MFILRKGSKSFLDDFAAPSLINVHFEERIEGF